MIQENLPHPASIPPHIAKDRRKLRKFVDSLQKPPRHSVWVSLYPAIRQLIRDIKSAREKGIKNPVVFLSLTTIDKVMELRKVADAQRFRDNG
jgi:hypothetical protein